jgi:hypothetical protein
LTLKPRAFNLLFKDFSIELSDRTVRPDGATAHLRNLGASFVGWDLHVGILAPFLGEDLDADVIILMRSAPVVVAVDLAV